MKPAIADVTKFLGEILRTQTVPELTGFHANDVAMAAAMIDMVAEAWDGAAARLVAENADFAAVLGDAAGDNPGDLRISALMARNDALRTRLIALQADAESRTDAAARDLQARIWAALRRSVAARRVASASF